jgi:hypothetical protein
MIESGKPAVLIMNCAVLGRDKTNVHKFKVYDPEPYAQYERTVLIVFTERKRRNSKKPYAFASGEINIL